MKSAPAARPAARRAALRAAAWSAAVLVLALVSLSYFNPHLMLDLADRLWSCF